MGIESRALCGKNGEACSKFKYVEMLTGEAFVWQNWAQLCLVVQYRQITKDFGLVSRIINDTYV
jgi:hypothetical protein